MFGWKNKTFLLAKNQLEKGLKPASTQSNYEAAHGKLPAARILNSGLACCLLGGGSSSALPR